MSDKFSPTTRSYIMSQIKQKNTKIEELVFSELRKRKIYFKKHYNTGYGTPDVALPRKKVAIFIDGDFWHGYRFTALKKRLNSEFWINKIDRNRKRDLRNFSKLRELRWKVLRVWEHELVKNPEKAIYKVVQFMTG